MPAGSHDITIEQGATWTLSLSVTVGGSLLNLSGYSARAQVRRSHGSTTATVSLTSATGGGITLGGALGTVVLTMTATATAALTPGVYVWDLELVSGSGTVTRLLEGTCLITAEVTR